MMTDPILKTPYLLKKSEQVAVSTAINKSLPNWPRTFDRKIKDVRNRTKDVRAIDYIDTLIYVIPTVAIEQLELTKCPEAAISSLVHLIKACDLSLSWEQDQQSIDTIQQ